MQYTVKSGDTVAKLANTYKTTVAAIAKANPQITNINLIKIGQKIEIPMPSSVSVPAVAVQAAAPVKAGFDLSGIFADKKKLLFTVLGLAAVAAFFVRRKEK